MLSRSTVAWLAQVESITISVLRWSWEIEFWRERACYERDNDGEREFVRYHVHRFLPVYKVEKHTTGRVED